MHDLVCAARVLRRAGGRTRRCTRGIRPLSRLLKNDSLKAKFSFRLLAFSATYYRSGTAIKERLRYWSA